MNLWTSGNGATVASSGSRYTTLGSTTSLQLSNTFTNLRATNIFARAALYFCGTRCLSPRQCWDRDANN